MGFEMLTPRELEIAKDLACALTNAEIAKRLGISIKTVDTHRLHVMAKLKLKNNAMLVHAALQAGIVEPLRFELLKNAAKR